MPLTAAEEKELAHLNSLAENNTSSKLSAEEEEEYAYLNSLKNKSLSAPEKTWTHSAQDMGEDILSVPKSVGKGMAHVADMIGYPVRKGLETILGREIPTLVDQGPSINYNTGAGRIAGKGGEFLGETLAMGPVGRAFSIASALAKTPLGKNVLSKTGEFLGDFSNPSTAHTLQKVATGTGLASGTLQEAGMDPVAADIIASLGVPGSMVLKERGVPLVGKKSAERKLTKEIQKNLSPEEINQISSRLANYSNNIPGYTPATADIASNPYFSNLERAWHGGHAPEIGKAELEGTEALENAFRSLSPEDANIGSVTEHFHGLHKEHLTKAEKAAAREQRLWERSVDKAQNNYERALQKRDDILTPYKGDTRQEHGANIKRTIEDYLAHEKDTRRNIASPLFESLKDVEVSIPFKNAENYLNKGIEETDPIRKKLQSLLGNLNNTSSTHPDLANIEKQFGHYGESALSKIKEAYGYGDHSSGGIKASEVQQTLENLGEAIYIAKRGGNWSDALHLERFKRALEEDISTVSELGTARSTYKDLSQNIGHLESDKKGLAKAIKKDVYGTHYQTGDIEIPEMFFRGKKAVANTENLLHHFRGNKELLSTLRTQLYEDVVNNITDTGGNINLTKLHKYSRDNPAVYLIDPNFNKFKDKLTRTQQAVNKSILEQKKITRNSPKAGTQNPLGEHEPTFKNVLGNRLEGLEETYVVSNILSGKNRSLNMERVVNIAKNSPEALDGLKLGVIEHILNNIDIKSPSKKTVDFLRQNHGAFSKLFTKEEMKLYNELQHAIGARSNKIELAKTRGSPTSSNLAVLGEHLGNYGEKALQKFLDKTLWIGGDIRRGYKEIRHNQKKNMISKMLTDPSYAHEIIKKVS